MRGITLAMLLLVGCSPGVEDLCERLQEECPETEFPYDINQEHCIDDGLRLQESADASDCSDAFDEYLDCIDARGCHWNTDCVAERDRVLACTGAS